MQVFSTHELELVFGIESRGTTPHARANTATVKFVRSQLQLAHATPNAKGRILTASEALEVFGWETLRRVGLERSAPLLNNHDEPSRTLRERREQLGLSVEEVARRIQLWPEEIKHIETSRTRSPIRTLEKLAQALALDERELGFKPTADSNMQLGVRLRQLVDQSDVTGFTSATVLQLAEAAWVIDREYELSKALDVATDKRPAPDKRYAPRAYEIGYGLARITRRKFLGLEDDQPIESMRSVVQECFGIPLVQQSMNPQLAGATLANGSRRGILVNERGMNSNVWVRRMTICHELGHLLWDPDENLQQVCVDQYAELEQNEQFSHRDPAEIRANAFAIAFLAPPIGVQAIADRNKDIVDGLMEVIGNYGISPTAARYHFSNVTGRQIPQDLRLPHLEPEVHWIVAENLTIDFFPLQKTPLSRRGRFAEYVARLHGLNAISDDTAAMYLGVDVNQVVEALPRIRELFS